MKKRSHPRHARVRKRSAEPLKKKPWNIPIIRTFSGLIDDLWRVLELSSYETLAQLVSGLLRAYLRAFRAAHNLRENDDANWAIKWAELKRSSTLVPTDELMRQCWAIEPPKREEIGPFYTWSDWFPDKPEWEDYNWADYMLAEQTTEAHNSTELDYQMDRGREQVIAEGWDQRLLDKIAATEGFSPPFEAARNHYITLFLDMVHKGDKYGIEVDEWMGNKELDALLVRPDPLWPNKIMLRARKLPPDLRYRITHEQLKLPAIQEIVEAWEKKNVAK